MKGQNIGKLFILFLAIVLLVGGGSFLYIWVSGGSGEPTRETEAENVESRQEESVVYEVDPDSSEARFIIGEVLRGEENTVEGRTDQIDGSVALRPDSNELEIGEFVINVRSIETDDEVRDRTIRSRILESNQDEYEFSTFDPTELTGLPESIEIGDSFSFEVTGELTIRDVTSSVTFDMSLDIRSEDEIEGSASTTLEWDDFDITIPSVGGDSIVASVEESVDLELEFVATAAEG